MNCVRENALPMVNTEPAEFAVMVDDLLSQLPQNEVIIKDSLFRYSGYE